MSVGISSNTAEIRRRRGQFLSSYLPASSVTRCNAVDSSRLISFKNVSKSTDL
jgi:hypothetical protein